MNALETCNHGLFNKLFALTATAFGLACIGVVGMLGALAIVINFG